jgi:pectate lyase
MINKYNSRLTRFICKDQSSASILAAGYRGIVFLIGFILMTCHPGNVFAQQLAFPTAEGFGAYAQGGRGGDVYRVTNLDDDGPGSLRYGIRTAGGPRTIVFAVSGIIRLRSELAVDKNYITIAGQTAPGDGICLRDNRLAIEADHVIVRYIRSRLGDESRQETDAISINQGHHVIMDHCSASWSVDEVFSCSTGMKGQIDSITVQWCIISEALNNSVHRKGPHGYGSLIRGCYGAKYTYHHNLYAHNQSRNPRPGNYNYNNHKRDPLGLQFDFRNNVMYNWGGDRPGYDADAESVCRYNYVGNYGKPGPDSKPRGWAYSADCKYFKAYYSGNYFYGSIPADPWSLVNFQGKWSDAELKAYKQDVPFSTGPMSTESALDAFTHVLAYAGASLVRDVVDERIVRDVKNGTGSIIDSQAQVGGWPACNGLPAPADGDLDGMPDAWEKQHGLDPDNPGDRNGDPDRDGYTNLEEYLNELAGSFQL